MYKYLLAMVFLLLTISASATEVQRRTANDGQLVMEDIPAIPPTLGHSIARYQNIRAAWISGWSEDSKSIYIKTRFGPVSQLHRVDIPGGARVQLTFGDEPIGEVATQPRGELLALTRDRDGDEFDQVLLLDPKSGLIRNLTEGHALNNRMAWDRQGQRVAYRSTRRNGRSNDVWVQGVEPAVEAQLVHEATDGALWKPIDFSKDGRYLLLQQFISVVDSRIWIKRLPDGDARLLAGSAENPASNVAAGFDRNDANVLFVTNQRNGAAELASVSLDAEQLITFVPSVGDWDITQFVLSRDRKRGAFTTNENGISRLYLYDPALARYRRVEKMPVGLISGLTFSPDGKKLGMTLNSARSPNDAWVLELGRKPFSAKKLKRWTFSEVGGLDTGKFSTPIPIKYPSPFGQEDKVLSVPAFVYLPPGDGPFPVIIHVHGGPENQFRPSFNSEFQLWIDQLGVAVIAPNIRGSLGYGARYIALDDGYQREDAVKDIGALLDWIAMQPRLDQNRVVVFGASYGGYMALASAVHYGDRLRAAVDRVGISNFVTFLENTQDYRQALRRTEYGDERDPQMRAFLESISPLNNVDKINIPLLVVQGKNDPIVPMSESEQLVKALRLRGQTVWYMNALNEGHGYDRKENHDLYQQATILFLRKYLLPEN
jgi:dipeptidyl aminopeptidase/acylaminoacyl peptidase